jgi:thiol:disulfide interchange protein DsbC
MKKIVEERKDIAFYLKVYARPNTPDYEKAKAILCEKSLTLLESAYEKVPIPPAKCQTTLVDDNMRLAQKLGVNGLPGIIFPDGRLTTGWKDAKTLINLIVSASP